MWEEEPTAVKLMWQAEFTLLVWMQNKIWRLPETTKQDKRIEEFIAYHIWLSFPIAISDYQTPNDF